MIRARLRAAPQARSLWKRPRLWITGGVLLALAATAYPLVSQRQPEVVTSESGLKVLVAGDSNGGMDARISGRLSNVGGCLGIETGNRQYLAVWPSGTTPLSGTSVRVRFPDDSVAAVGDSVDGSGGFIERKPYPKSVPAIPSSCAVDTFFLFNTVQVLD